MAIDRQQLIQRVQEIEGLSDDERAGLLQLLREQKKYGIVWEEKPEEAEERLATELPVLTEDKDRFIPGATADAPNHILIEGDNLHALTALSYTHEGKIDVIYIDPPYNTGNKDFVYNDSYVDREDGYRHSKWLSFMSKRLRIAKRLLSDRGVIFISIDDNEQAQLKLLCDEVFGEWNYLGQLILKTATDNNATQINTEHEYMMCFCVSRDKQGNWKRTGQAAKLIIEKHRELKSLGLTIPVIQKELRKWIKENKSILPQVAHYNNVDEKGVYSSSSNSSNPHPGDYTYDILHPITKLPCPKPQNGWRWPASTFAAYDLAGEIEWGLDESTQPHVKKRIETATDYLRTLIYEDNRGTTMALADIFNGKKVFDNPKPLTVLKRVIDFASDKNSTILDFFAGSGTTLHATMQLNAEDGGRRQCILVTNNENGICENVTYERNRRVIQGYTTPKGVAVPGLTANTLRYYRTDFVPNETTIRNKRRLMALATDMLCIKNNLYCEQDEFAGRRLNKGKMRYFTGTAPLNPPEGGRRIDTPSMLVVYDEYVVDSLVDVLAEMDVEHKIMIYVFSNTSYPHTDNFEEVLSKVELCALPSAILNAYRKITGR